MAIEGIFFPGHNFPSKSMGAFASKAVSDGILTGCSVSRDGSVPTNVTIGPGFMIADGRVVQITTSEVVSNVPENANGSVYLRIDTTNPVNPALSLIFLDSAPNDTDINVQDGVYDGVIVNVNNGSLVPNYAGGSFGGSSGWNTIWSGTIEGQTISELALSDATSIYILFCVDSSASANDKIYFGQTFRIPSDMSSIKYVPQSFKAGDSRTYSKFYSCDMLINKSGGSITFANNRYVDLSGRNYGSGSQYMTPILIDKLASSS